MMSNEIVVPIILKHEFFRLHMLAPPLLRLNWEIANHFNPIFLHNSALIQTSKDGSHWSRTSRMRMNHF